MANISFFQCIIVIILLFLMFGDTQTFKQNFHQVKVFFLTKKEKSSYFLKKDQEKRDSNP